MTTWKCAPQCGACCYLNPAERPALDYYLTPEELATYVSLVGDDGWCIHFDQGTRKCQIYADRPQFCRVEAPIYEEIYGVPPEELSDFAIECCREHILDVYGEPSPESDRFERAIQDCTENPHY